MKRRLAITDAAKADLVEIWRYIGAEYPAAADHLIDEITAKFDLLEDMPDAGRTRDELAPRVRSFPVKRYLIFYRLSENTLEILRVVHGARDLPTLFAE